MKAIATRVAFALGSFVLVFGLIACSPKNVVRGRVVDAETRRPIQGAAIAIKWYAGPSAERSDQIETIDAAQALSDEKGLFRIPEYPSKQYNLGVYKTGYICWSSRDVFLNRPTAGARKPSRPNGSPRMSDGMIIELVPFKNMHSRNLHAGFTVMVAGESTDNPEGPFHQAIESEYNLWRENLRKDFQKQLGVK